MTRSLAGGGGPRDLTKQISRVLAAHGAHVVLACRSVEKGKAAAALIGGDSAVVRLDLGSLASVRSAAEEIRARYPQLDLLINNTSSRSWLTCCSRSSSTAGCRRRGVQTSALAPHPGVVYTNLFATASTLHQALLKPRARIINFWAVQDVRMGALPALRAATDPAARGADYFGPRRYGLRRRFYTGYPDRVEPSASARDAAVQARLWQVSEQLTGVSYRIA